MHPWWIALALIQCLPVAMAAPPPSGALFPAGGQRGQTVEITASGKFDRWPVQTWVEGDGVQLVPDPAEGKLHLRIADDAAPGVRWVRLFNTDGPAKPVGISVGLLPELIEAEPNDAPSQAQSISPLPVTINGKLEKKGDVDTFSVYLQAGETLIADLEANRRRGVPMDGTLQILSPQGFLLYENDDAGSLDPRVAYTAKESGPVLVRLFAFPESPNQEIALSGSENYVYRLTLTTGSFVDQSFPMTVARGQRTAIELLGFNLPQNAIVREVAARHETAIDAYHPEAAGYATVAVSSEPVLQEAEPNDPSHAQALPLPCKIEGRIGQPNDVDVFAFEFRPEQPVLLRVESHQLGMPLDPVLTITDPSGKQVLREDDARRQRDIETTFQPKAAGLHQVAISNLFSEGGPRHAYRLTATAEPDFEATMNDAEISIAGGETKDVAIDIDRRLGYAHDIQIAAYGLPEGTECPAVLSKSEGETAKKVTLKITADSPPWSGPLWLEARSSTGTSVIARPIHPKNSGTAGYSGPAWLTITAPK